MLDMYYFKVDVFDDICIPINVKTNKAITQEDCILNSINEDICNFCNNVLYPNTNELYKKYNYSKLGFFYYPGETKEHIRYHFKTPTFIFSDIFTTLYPGKKNENENKLFFCSLYDKDIFLDSPECHVYNDDSTPEDKITNDVLNLLNDNKKLFLYFYTMTKDIFSSKTLKEIKGLIVRNNKNSIKIYNPFCDITNKEEKEINDIYNTTTKRMWRDMLLSSFISNTIKLHPHIDTELELSSNTYISKVCNLFVEFVDNSDFFNKYSLDEDDFLPTWDTWLLAFNYKLLPNETAKTLCSINPVAKSVLRFLIHSLRKHYSYEELKNLNTEQVNDLNRIVTSLSYHNYKEIARQKKMSELI